MIDMRNDAEVPEALDGDLLNAPLKIRLQLRGQAGCAGVEAVISELVEDAGMSSGRLIS